MSLKDWRNGSLMTVNVIGSSRDHVLTGNLWAHQYVRYRVYRLKIGCIGSLYDR